MKSSIIITSVLVFFIALSACKKESPKKEEDNISKPSIHVHQPVEGSMYHSGDTVPVKVHFEDDDELHDYQVTVRNETMGTNLLEINGHKHGTTHEVDTYVVVTAMSHADYVLLTRVSNHNGEEVADTTNFHVHH